MGKAEEGGTGQEEGRGCPGFGGTAIMNCYVGQGRPTCGCSSLCQQNSRQRLE